MTKTGLRLKAQPLNLCSRGSLNPKCSKNTVYWMGFNTYAQNGLVNIKPPSSLGGVKNR